MKKITILLAENHVVVRESIRRFLEREANFEVVGEAGDGEEAVQMASQLKPDVIVMDISMPKLNGIEATRQIKASQPLATILMLTAYDYDQYVSALLEAGAAGYLLKDVSAIMQLTSDARGFFLLSPGDLLDIQTHVLLHLLLFAYIPGNILKGFRFTIPGN
ncbi:unnamed protein product [marine sediment metagenome]|uniref:Response regulatory domain-containing protein n=1 Tax=marine sediment metagenome TaxID=412755 RepID=X1MLE2_9ZZZZ